MRQPPSPAAPTTAVLLVLLAVATARAADAPVWSDDLDAARTRAQADGKDLLVVFTGLGWCVPCQQLQREVLEKPAFVELARWSFVLVELDFTFGKTPDDGPREKKLRALQKQYLVTAFPTVVLADAQGVPYAYHTGSVSGLAAAKLPATLLLARAARARRDESFRLAQAATGDERAEHLDRGLRAVAGYLGSLDDRGDDPVLTFYPKQVGQILAVPGPLRTQYQDRKRRRDAWIAREAVFSQLKEFDARKDYRGAVGHIDAALGKPLDPDLRWRLEWARQVYLEWDGRHAEALANARRLMEPADLSAGRREQLLDRESYNLFNLGRFDEGMAQYDRRIAATSDARKRLRLLRWKAEMACGRDHPDEAVAACQTLRAAAERGGEDWLMATLFLAHELQKAGKHREALRYLDEGLAADGTLVGLMLDAATSHLALGEKESARTLLRRAEEAGRKLKDSPSKLDHDVAAHVERRAKELRTRLDALP